ncbi:MAG TPA: UDP-3-O-(3-hydroxymyristoyl)glucosamine N-acyltransferase [Granulicella sp.]|jgi:UDP-3-O-[3-hydroxymyristoyl] glucosamine N-acyltransferase|nr:UDP-3-O-(3-hydroxymyristoyl)glucosamine N-acyltransferase [Granulicella sp.]
MATRSQIASWTGAEAGDVLESAADFDRVSSIESASAGSIVFATDVTTLASALASPAGLVLAPISLKAAHAANAAARTLWLRDPRYGFAVVAQRLEVRQTAQIHPTAIVSPSAEVGEGTSIGPGAVVLDGVKLGRGCEIGPRVTIYPHVVLGDRVQVQAGAVLGAKGFGYARNAESGEYVLFPQQGMLVIEDDVDIGANTTIDRGALGETRIGRGTKIDNLVHIGHNCVIGRNVIIAAQTGISGSSVVEDGAILGGQVGIGEHATVGAGVILGGGAGVLTGKKMHGPGEVFWGRPARPLKEYLRDLARLKRR